MPIEEKIEQNIALAQFTTFKIGGPAKFFVEVDNEHELIEAISWAKSNGHKFFILGGGSNLLICDRGYEGLVIKNESKELFRDGNKIICDSGVALARLILSCTRHNLRNLEWAIGIPGTIGGAIRGNAGANGYSTSKIIESVKVFRPDDNKIVEMSNEECGFDYRHSIFKYNNFIILGCTLKLTKGDPIALKKEIDENLAKRIKSQPKYPNAGCIFKNISVKDFDLANDELRELVEEAKSEGAINDDKLSAGWIISKLYLKGKWIGGARVSLDHANYIINKHLKATSDDVLMLISLIKQKVRVEYGMQLKEEIYYLDY